MDIDKPIAIIPARGDSKRIVNKNIVEINGKPLLCYAIDICNESGIFSEVYVNTDSDDIFSISQQCGAKAYRRPKRLATDTAYVIDVIKEMINTLNFHKKNMGVLLPTSPLRTAIDLNNAWNLYQEKRHSVISVCKYETPIQLAHFVNSNGELKPFFPNEYAKTTRSIGHRQSYRFNGAIVFNSAHRFLSQSNLIGNSPYPYIMPEERSIDIDHSFQLDLVNMIIRNRGK